MTVREKACRKDVSTVRVIMTYQGYDTCERVLCRFVKLALDTWKEDGAGNGRKAGRKGLQDRDLCP